MTGARGHRFKDWGLPSEEESTHARAGSCHHTNTKEKAERVPNITLHQKERKKERGNKALIIASQSHKIMLKRTSHSYIAIICNTNWKLYGPLALSTKPGQHVECQSYLMRQTFVVGMGFKSCNSNICQQQYLGFEIHNTILTLILAGRGRYSDIND